MSIKSQLADETRQALDDKIYQLNREVVQDKHSNNFAILEPDEYEHDTPRGYRRELRSQLTGYGLFWL